MRFILCFLGIILLVGCKNDAEVATKLYRFNVVVKDSVIGIHQKSEMKLYDITDAEPISYKGTIERRGGGSIKLSKFSYEIDLKKDVPLAHLPEDDDWILNATYIDKTFIRHVLSYELFSIMGENNIVSKSQYVELEINGKYQGLYILMEKLDKSSLDIKKSDSLAMIFKEPFLFIATYKGAVPQYEHNFHQQTYPRIKQEDKGQYLENIRQLILNSEDEEFTAGITDMLDIDNIIDWHLLLLMTNNSDGILKNFYLYKKDNETPFRVAPWDYDHSFGRDSDNELNLDERPVRIERSILFKRLLQFDWYKKRLKKKWLVLNDNDVFSVKGLKNRILKKSEGIKDAANKNFEYWKLDGEWYFDDNNFDQEIDIMLKFVDLRHRRLTKYFDSL